MDIETIKSNRIEMIKEFIFGNGLENLNAQEIANIYNMIKCYKEKHEL